MKRTEVAFGWVSEHFMRSSSVVDNFTGCLFQTAAELYMDIASLEAADFSKLLYGRN